MSLPNINEARKRTDKKTEYIYLDKEYDKSVFDGKKYYLKTYGCQMNVHDSEEIAARLESIGFSKVDELESADLVILNTCAIRENAHDKLYGFLGRCKHVKTSINKNLIIAICGCMAQEESVCNFIKDKHPYVDLVFGTHNICDLEELLINKEDNKQKIEVHSCEGNVYENIKYSRDSKFKAWVNIQYGCDKFCTYCIVPYTRGKQRRRKSQDIIKEVEELVNSGYIEVTLLGQNVNAYGKDLEGELNFAELLQKTADTGIKRLRFVTSHPWDFTDEMIDAISRNENIMPYIHLPLQSGSDRILKLMGRRYTKKEYIDLFNKIKDKVKNASITTDIIVGFPNETEDDFNETLDVVNTCKFDSAFTFIYSPREGTPAAKMDDKVSLEEKENRLYKLNDLINNYSLMHNNEYVGKTVEVLVEGLNEKDSSKLFGYTDTMKLVNFTGSDNLIGKLVNVDITDAKSFSLDGKIKE